ncbi:MAG: hypothetical protein NT033_05125 [Candidatus Omnitrophica bacterium]|nr:hypothetical protein [Candidatus Omnitrophota bacterium]
MNNSNYEFLLCNKKFIEPSTELLDIFSGIAPSKQYQPLTAIDSYPEGPDAFFWEIMDYVNGHYEKDGGFVLWFESDMIPVMLNWVDLLEAEWRNHPGVLIMGLRMPNKYFIKIGTFVLEHINGGACYSKDLSKAVSQKYREKYFDVSTFQYIKKTQKYFKTKLFKFSHIYSLLGDIENNKAIVLHGYRQDKDRFISKAISLVESNDARKCEKEILSKIPRKERLCCDFAVSIGFLVNCPIHETDGLFTQCKNNVLFYLMCFIKKLYRIVFRLYGP